MERFGMHFVASPRHADLLLVTGPVTRNMEIPLRRTYEATPAPKVVVAVGDCAKTCGVFKGSYAVVGPVDRVIPVDVHILGCPPEPSDILRGILEGVDRFAQRAEGASPGVVTDGVST
jgi:Ni,Fe-hydrogenase III small subunit